MANDAQTKPRAKPADEEAHFRIDEHERRLSGIESALKPEVVSALVHGAMAALAGEMQNNLNSQMQQLVKVVREDVATDKGVIEEVRKLVGAVGELVRVLKAPVTRTSTVHLPSGPVSMTATERREIERTN
jgi:hypothetical protein